MPLTVRRHRIVADLRARWDEIAGDVDAIWAIAPESDGVLGEIARWIERTGRRTLGCAAAAITVAASKHATVDLLERCGIAAVSTRRCTPDVSLPPSRHGWVVKPDDGVACDGARFLATPDEVHRWISANEPTAEMVVQPFVPGRPISLSILAQHGSAWLLTCNTQDIRRSEAGFAYQGGIVGGAEDLRRVLTAIAEAIGAALPSLWGYVGIDLVVCEDGPVLLEINPRLTSSYLGLRKSIGMNPAELVLQMIYRPLSSLITPLAPRPVRVTVEP
jgi:predicted ATP-grasp superfamily ATP-dependent carboligase